MSEQEKDRLNKHAELAYNNAFYAMSRIDLLIVSISGASIYICLEIIKYIKTQNLDISTIYFKLSGIVFVFSIIVNFIGQWASYKTNIIDYEIKKLAVAEDTSDKIKNLECDCTIYGKITNICNTLSTFSMLLGLILLITSISCLL